MKLTPEQRSARARIAAHEMHAQNDPVEVTANWRANSPGSLTYWEREVDPDRVLDAEERRRRATHKRSAYMASLAFKKAAKAKAKKPRAAR